MTQCPDRNLLEQLVTVRLMDTELDELDRHVKGCASCQHTLEGLTDDPIWTSWPRHDVSTLFDEPRSEPLAVALVRTVLKTDQANNPETQRVSTVPGYQIDGELGRGGMGVVYLARHLRLNRPCALKMILSGLHASPEHVSRFVTEAEAIARLEHPNIVQIR
jgi:eukaryotic-like serine/threonine-protein kinase